MQYTPTIITTKMCDHGHIDHEITYDHEFEVGTEALLSICIVCGQLLVLGEPDQWWRIRVRGDV